MRTATTTARTWTCHGCGVSVGQIDGTAIPMPDSWAESDDGELCLVCRREHAAEVALESAPAGSSHRARADLRRAALLEFEVSRTPDLSDGAIAKACRTSVTAVAKARRRLELADSASAAGGRDG